MNELLEILKELHPDVDYENCTTLIDDKILDSFDIVSIISEVSDSFDVAPSYVDKTNAATIKSMLPYA